MNAPRYALDWLGRLHRIVGGPGLMIALTSLVSFVFGLFMLVREYDKPRDSGRAVMRSVLKVWARAPYYPGLNLIDWADRWREARPEDREPYVVELNSALMRLGGELIRQEERFPLVRVESMELKPGSGETLVRWTSDPEVNEAAGTVVENIRLLEASGSQPSVDLVARYRLESELTRGLMGLETSYRRLLLALAGLSGYSLLCLGYMALQARNLRDRAAVEAAREATLDLADRACHELGNGVFVLSNERRNLVSHLELVDRFLTEEADAFQTAARRAGLDSGAIARLEHALRREREHRQIDPEADLRPSLALARDVCRQIAACSDFLTLTVRDLDGHLKDACLPVAIEPVNLGDCLSEAGTMLGPRLTDVVFQAEIDPDSTVTMRVLADRRLLLHALINLLKNAQEATAGDPNARVVVSWRRHGNHAEIDVADNGPGLPAGLDAAIFDGGRSTKGPGRGRGLAIVRDAIRSQGGTISSHQPGGHGALFRIRLPLDPEAIKGSTETMGHLNSTVSVTHGR
ncbi:sensor histidine kinase [Isosphaeraceae bacterium EP7]